jgi:hypothetical protein
MDRREGAEFSFALGATGEPKGLMLPNDRTAQKLCFLRT